MRGLPLFLAAGLAALTLILAGCGGDDQQQQTQQPQQAQAQQEHERPAARPQAAQTEQSTQAQQAQAQTEQQTAESQQDASAEVEETARFDDPLLDEAFAAYTEWSAGLESIVLDVETEFNPAGLAVQISATVAAEFEPLTILTTLDATNLLTMLGDGGAGETDGEEELFLMVILMKEDAVYLTMPMAEGWIDLTSEAEEALEGLTGVLGGDPSQLADPVQLGQAFGCIDAVGGSARVGSHDGESAWIIECEIDVDALNEAATTALQEQGIEVVEVDIEAMRLRLAISQQSGAPLLIETETTLRDTFGFSEDGDDEQSGSQFYVNTVTRVRSWNEPIDFPTPEPLVDGSLIDAFASSTDDGPDAYSSGQSDPPELLNAAQLLDLALQWVADIDEMHLEFVAEAVIDGESRLAAVTVLGSRSARCV